MDLPSLAMVRGSRILLPQVSLVLGVFRPAPVLGKRDVFARTALA